MARHLAHIDAGDEEDDTEEAHDEDGVGAIMEKSVEVPCKNEGLDLDDIQPVAPCDLKTNRQAVLAGIQTHILGEKVKRKRLKGAPAWIVEKELLCEDDQYWK